MTTLSVMANPPRGSKQKRRASPAQIAWRKKFAERFGGGNKKSKGRGRSSRRARTNPPSTLRAKRRGSGGGGGRGHGLVRDLLSGAMGGATVGVGGAIGFAATSKLPDYIPPAWLRDASGSVPLWKRFAAKIAAGLAVYVPTRVAGRLVGGRAGAVMSKAAEAMLAGSTTNVLFDMASRAVPQVAPKTLTGGDGDDMGEFVYAQVSDVNRGALPAGAGVGAFINSNSMAGGSDY